MSEIDEPLTVAELGQIAFPQGTRLVGGARGLDRGIEWVTSLRASFPLFADLAPGYLALASPALGRRLDSLLTVDRLITELASAGAAGLLVDEPVAPRDATLADDLGLPVFVAPPSTDLRALEREVVRALVDREGQRLRRATEARERYQSLLASGGIDSVVRDVSASSEARVLVEDARGAPVAAAGRVSGHEDATRQVIPIQAAGRHLGRLVVEGPAGLGPSLLTLQAAAEACGLEMLRRAARQETEDQLAADIVGELLGLSGDDTLLRSRLDRLGFAPEADRKFVALAVSGRDVASSRAAGAALARELRALGAREDVRTIAGCHDEAGICLLSCSSAVQFPRDWLTGAIRRLPRSPLCIGVGRWAGNLPGLRESISQALAAQSLGRRLGATTGAHYYEDLGLERLLAGLRDQAELRRFYDETVGLLAAYDRAHSTDLLATLRTFFEQNANASQAARVLCVHRNTLDYRLQRVEEITGLDLADADARLTLQLALKIHLLAPWTADCATRTDG